MKKALSGLKHLIMPGGGETDPVLSCKREDASPSYMSINHSDTSGSSHSSESDSRGSAACPSCRGTGRIPRGQEKELVALIPYSDQRLKPRRTKLYVFLAVISCLLICFMVIFFLFPRSISINHAGVNSSYVKYDADHRSVNLLTTNKLNISNKNLFAIEVTQLNIEFLHLSVVVGNFSKANFKKIGPLVSEQVFYTVESTIQDENTFYICTWSQFSVHNILLHVQGTMNCSYLGHWEQLTFEGYEYLDCRNNATVPHLVLSNPP
ncbi:transmembrane protein 106A [Bombina bombina]|uniref:transmembrane protein 106A n=1 Tax=Bombina bombina TaxID=8345 RepID=UPI00235B2CB8|nr:transmembrane protein 106A [Bombina bombina]XP_053555565.1 transmembrane protein 106A [Bombina bombina]XP_053555566.1 transmembrane protein 106A [Bombina bombina]XP_053555567.1 transmembrane protein 106A [Bombina bombina]